jgi:hypothetical protein
VARGSRAVVAVAWRVVMLLFHLSVLTSVRRLGQIARTLLRTVGTEKQTIDTSVSEETAPSTRELISHWL